MAMIRGNSGRMQWFKTRHGRTCCGHPRLNSPAAKKGVDASQLAYTRVVRLIRKSATADLHNEPGHDAVMILRLWCDFVKAWPVMF